ncbi:hypothetical protein EDB84DRAFT_1567164 [Lactarius hengduanensis]|nr:hypothetical protein EDB84DRAFT_1567164 [Lactarius hengduanensis]
MTHTAETKSSLASTPTHAPKPEDHMGNPDYSPGEEEEFTAAANALPLIKKWELLAILQKYDDPSIEERWEALSQVKNRNRHHDNTETRRNEVFPAPARTPSPPQPPANAPEEEGQFSVSAFHALADEEQEELLYALLEYDDPTDEELWRALSKITERSQHRDDTQTTHLVTDHAEARAAETISALAPPHTPNPARPTIDAREEANNLATTLHSMMSEGWEDRLVTLLEDSNLGDNELEAALSGLVKSDSPDNEEDEWLNALIYGDSSDLPDPAELTSWPGSSPRSQPPSTTIDDRELAARATPAAANEGRANPLGTPAALEAYTDHHARDLHTSNSLSPLASTPCSTGALQVEALAVTPACGAALPPSFPSYDPGMTPLLDRLDATSDYCEAARERPHLIAQATPCRFETILTG